MSTELAKLPALSAALVAAQKDAGAVLKSAYNSHQSYEYADAEGVIGQARAALNAHGLAVAPAGVRFIGQGEHPFFVREFVVRHESGESYVADMLWAIVSNRGKPADKAIASAETTALAYFLRTLLLMPRLTRDQMDRGDFASDLALDTTPIIALPSNQPGLGKLAGALLERIRKPGSDLGTACEFVDAQHAAGALTDDERDRLHEAIDYENGRLG